MSEDKGRSSRIAIQLGKPSTSSPNGIKKRTRPTHTRQHRAHDLHEDSGSGEDSDRDEQPYGRQETITSYDILGASSDDGKAKRLNDSVGLEAETTTAQKGTEEEQQKEKDVKDGKDGSKGELSELQEKPVKWGLNINIKGSGRGKVGETGGPERQTNRRDTEGTSGPNGSDKKSIDDEALDALMGSRIPKRKHADSDAADREPRAEDYRSVPIDDFGARLLRNFGWDGKMRGKVKEVTRHANLTGLGAKDAKGAEDLGAWNQKPAKDSRPMRLNDYRREENKKRQRIEDRYADSYKRERERERERERG
ncbi:hypothetical protein VTH82DRAFT_570 [Thermothelomyces myriococcoides]